MNFLKKQRFYYQIDSSFYCAGRMSYIEALADPAFKNRNIISEKQKNRLELILMNFGIGAMKGELNKSKYDLYDQIKFIDKN